MHPRIRGYLDAVSIYVVIVLFAISAIDYVTIDQTKRVSGLTMLILIAAILISRLLARQQRQINAMKARLQGAVPQTDKAPHYVPKAPTPTKERTSMLEALTQQHAPSNILDFPRR